jgi:exonuclease SbcC
VKLKNLELINYRKFKKASIEFPEGVIGILGLNGVGKSTIIEAISWALYGNETKIVRTKKEDLKRYGAGPNEECAVNLAFELDGDKYTVTRKMTGKNYNTSANVLVNNKSVATSTKSVTALLEKRLGMDYQAFYTSIFAKQKELNELSTLDPNKRKKLILRMLNIDSIDKAIISVRTDNRELRTRLTESRSVLYEPDGELKIETAKNKIKENEKKVQDISANIESMGKQKEQMVGEQKSLEKRRTSMRKLKDEYNKLNTKLTEYNTSIEKLQEQLEKLEERLAILSNQQKELKKLEPQKKAWEEIKKKKADLELGHGKYIRSMELQQQLRNVQGDIKNYNNQLIKAQTELKKFADLAKEQKNAQTAIDDLETEIIGYRKSTSEAELKIQQLEAEIKKIQSKLQDIEDLGPESKCPTCERDLGEQFGFLKDKFSNELTEIKKNVESNQKVQKSTKKSLDDALKRKEALKKRQKHLNQLTSDRARVEESIKGSEAELKQNKAREKKLHSELEKYKDLKFDLKEYKQVKGEYLVLEHVNEKYIGLKERVESIPNVQKDLEESKDKQKDITSKKTQLEGKITQLGFDDKKLEELETKFDDDSRKMKEFELGMKDKENDLKIYQQEITQLAERVKELSEIQKKTKEYEDRLMYLNKLDSIFNKFKNYMIGRIAPTLTQYASDLFRELTGGKYNRLEVNEDYDVLIYDNGEEFPLSRFSGGEEDLANLCLRLAISQVIAIQAGTTGPNFVILDEIFGSQDLYRKRNLLQSLNELTNKFRQIFLITHIEDVKDFIEYNLHVTENEDGSSTVRAMG